MVVTSQRLHMILRAGIQNVLMCVFGGGAVLFARVSVMAICIEHEIAASALALRSR